MLKRETVETKYKWNLTHIYKNEAEVEEAFKAMDEYAEGITQFRGTLNSAEAILKCYNFCEKYNQKIEVLSAYILFKESEDESNKQAKTLSNRFSVKYTNICNASAFVETEILKNKDADLKKIIADPRLADFSYGLSELYKKKKHILPEKEEILINNACRAFDYNDIFNQFNAVEVDRGSVKLDNGKTVKITPEGYSNILSTQSRETRKAAYEANGAWKKNFFRTIGSTYLGSVKADSFDAKAHKYASSLESSLSGCDIPEEVYKTLLYNYTKYLPVLKRYFKIRKNVLGVNKLYVYDCYVGLGKYKPKKISYEDCYNIVLDALSVFGDEYINILKTARDNRWIDVFETENKHTGAYMCECYGVHPYVLFNFSGLEDYATTIAHELGHAVNSYKLCTSNRYSGSGNPIFLAEIASTVNEILMNCYLIDHAATKEKKIYYLNELITMFNGTFYRQTMFAKFEEAAHAKVDADEPISVYDLNDIYAACRKEHNCGVVETTEIDKLEYLGIPHFYRSFYVYKYATGVIAAINIVLNILADKNYIDSYFKFLSATSNQSPLSALSIAKVDMTKNETYDRALKFISEKVDELAKLTATKK